MTAEESASVTAYWRAVKTKRKEAAKLKQNLWINQLEQAGMAIEYMRDTGRGQFLIRNPARAFHESIVQVLVVPSQERWVVRYQTKFFSNQEVFDSFFAGKELPMQHVEIGIMLAHYDGLDELITFLNSGELP